VLKTWPDQFAAVRSGAKRHETRVNDRHYAVGDVLDLREWDPAVQAFTGEREERVVTYLTPGGTWGIPATHCVMSIAELPSEEETAALADIPEITFNLLSLAAVPGTREITLEQVEAWTPAERHEVEQWAAAIHVAASDNDDVEIPPTPAVLLALGVRP
jgi:hypothetical protein